jgi:hypothetical protein
VKRLLLWWALTAPAFSWAQEFSATAQFTPPSCHNGNDATITVYAQNGVPPYAYSLQEFGNYQSSNVFTGLSAGLYEVFVVDQADFMVIIPLTIPNPSPVQVNLQNVVSTFCDGGGGFVFGATGGTGGGYRFAVNGGPFEYTAGQSLAGLEEGTYEIFARDANGCQASTLLTLTQLPTIHIDFVITVTPSCNINDGQIRVLSVVNEGASVVYRLNAGPFQPFNVFNGLGPGTYTLTVRNEHGCTDVIEVVVPDPALALNVTVHVTPPSCHDANDGVINASVSGGGIPPYSYSLDGVDFFSSGFFNNLPDGDYLIFVQDAQGCMRVMETTVAAPAPLSPSPVVVHAACGQSNGSVTFNAVGGTPPYSFTFNGTTYAGGATVSALAAGTYSLTVTDANACSAQTAVTIYGLTNVNAQIAVLTTPICPGVNNGTVSITPGNTALGPFEYSADGAGFQSSGILTGLASGDYTFVVRTANGCVDLYPYTLSPVGTPSVSVELQNPGCQSADGVAVATVSGAQPPIVYRLNNGAPQTFNAFINLAAGQYTLQIIDANGCQAQSVFSLMNEGYFIQDMIINEPVCGAYNNGSIQVVASGGLPPYRFSINDSPFQPNPTFVQLGAGTYVIAVKDATGCVDTTTVIFPYVPPLTIDDVQVTPATCGQSDGTLRIVASGGTGQLLYSFDGQPFGTQFEFAGLASGAYELGVRDEFGCLAYTTFVVPSVGFALQIHVAEPHCGGSPTATMSVIPEGGAPPYEYLLQRELTSQTSPDGVFTGLVPGTYVLTVTDGTGCATIRTVAIGMGDYVQVQATTTPASGCLAADGTITLSATGGAGGYVYSLNGGPFGDSGEFAGLPPGSYAYVVRDAAGCETTGQVFVGSPVEILLDGTITHPVCGGQAGGSIQIVVSGGQPPYSFAWSDGSNQRDRAGLRAGTYSVTLTDANGCPAQRTFALTEPAELRLEAQNLGGGRWKAVATGGTPPYLFALNSALYQSDSVFDNLDVFNVFYVRDANNCTSTDTVRLVSRSHSTGLAVRVYPNPNDGDFTVSLPYFSTLSLTDLTGKLVWIGAAQAGESHIGLPGHIKGTFLFVVENVYGRCMVKMTVK